jgi:hypothetical protein
VTDVPPATSSLHADGAARDDLAFLRALVQSGDGLQGPFGQIYLAGGLCYGAQLLLSVLGGGVLWPATPAIGTAIGLGPTVVFCGIMTLILWRSRRMTPPTGQSRAIAQVFSCLGLTNLAFILVIGAAAWREHSLTTWLIYPCCVFVLQGAAWMIAYTLRHRVWMLLVALGWFAAGTAMAVFIEDIALFIAAAGAGLMLCMALPGWLLVRRAKIVAY